MSKHHVSNVFSQRRSKSHQQTLRTKHVVHSNTIKWTKKTTKGKCLYFLLLSSILIIVMLMCTYNPSKHIVTEFQTRGGTTIHVIRYTTNGTANKLDEFDEMFWNSHKANVYNECTASSFQLIHHGCCAVQFTMNYLHSLGFTAMEGLDKRMNVKTMTNNKSNNIGCYGLNIKQRTSQKIRRFDNIGHKTKAYPTIMRYCMKHNIADDCKRWLPIQYNLRSTNERIEFFAHMPCSNHSSDEWLIKTDDHAGEGIFFIQNINDLRGFYLTKQEQMESNAQCIVDVIEHNNTLGLSKNAVAQQLISNTHKIYECNFHFRVWAFLANYNPLILLYVDTLVYRASDPDAIRSNHYQDPSHVVDWNWNLKQFEEYFDGKINTTQIVEEVKHIVGIMFLASYDEYHSNIKDEKDNGVQHYIQLAMDFIITTDNELKFLDLNRAPGTTAIPIQCFKFDVFGQSYFRDDNWQCVLGRKMMEEIVDIQIEIAIKKKNGQKITELDSINNFDVVLWKQFD